MDIKSNLNYVRIAPRKARLVANLVKGVAVKRAEAVLQTLPKRPALPISKLLHSAVANATHRFHLEKDALYIKDIRVDAGPVLKRLRPRAFGRTAPIWKRTSHVMIALGIKQAMGSVFPLRSLKSAPVVRQLTRDDKVEHEERKKTHHEAGVPGHVRRPRPIEFVRKIFRRKAI